MVMMPFTPPPSSASIRLGPGANRCSSNVGTPYPRPIQQKTKLHADRPAGPTARSERRVGVPADHKQHEHEADDIRDSDVPAVQYPAADGLSLGVHIGERHAGRGTEPDHRS